MNGAPTLLCAPLRGALHIGSHLILEQPVYGSKGWARSHTAGKMWDPYLCWNWPYSFPLLQGAHLTPAISTSHPVDHSPGHGIQAGPKRSLIRISADLASREPPAWVVKRRGGLLKAGPKQRQSPERRRKKLSLILWILAHLNFSVKWTGNSFSCLNKDDSHFTKRLLVGTATLVVSKL